MSSSVSDPFLPSPSPEPAVARERRAGDAVWLAFQARDRATVYVTGEIDISTAPQLRAAMSEALDGGRDVTVDLSHVTFFGVSGLNALAEAGAAAERVGRSLQVVGATGITGQVLQVGGLEGLLRARTVRP